MKGVSVLSERVTYRNYIEGEAYLKYGLVAKWEKMPRYDILNNAIQKLAEYEDLEEQGLLLRLPCKVGDTIYVLGDTMVVKSMCKGFEMRNNDWRVVCSNTGYSVTYEHFEAVFLTQSEAEEKLRELEGK